VSWFERLADRLERAEPYVAGGCFIVTCAVAIIALLMLLTGCVQVDKRVIVLNLAPCTSTHIDAEYASDTSTDAKPAVDLSVPLIP